LTPEKTAKLVAGEESEDPLGVGEKLRKKKGLSRRHLKQNQLKGEKLQKVRANLAGGEGKTPPQKLVLERKKKNYATWSKPSFSGEEGYPGGEQTARRCSTIRLRGTAFVKIFHPSYVGELREGQLGEGPRSRKKRGPKKNFFSLS